MKTKGVTLEQLAERFGKTVWVKGEVKRIYLNSEGFNTKKMSTKTFIFENDGNFIVNCHVECPSQPYQWIQAQEEEVKESVYARIEDYIKRILDPSIDAKEAEEVAAWEAAKKEMPKEVEVVKQEEPLVKIEIKKPVFEEGGKKYSHPTFGVGTVIEEDEQSITLTFEKHGKKRLLKRFAQLIKIA